MKRLVVLVAGLLSVALFAQAEETQNTKENTFSMKVQIRPRAEYRNGVLFPRPKDAESTGFINNRARLSLGYERDRLSIGLSAQHVGVWGQDPQIDKNGRFILNEAWAKLDFGSGFFAKLGRQSLVYDDERIMGALDWNVAGRYHDALKLGYENTNNQMHLILAFNQNDEKTIGGTYYAPGAQPYKTMQTLWYKHLFDKSFNASFLFMNLGMEGGDAEKQNSDTKYLQTLGTNLIYTPSNWTIGGTIYYQFGKTKSGRDVSAFLWAVNAAYQIDPQWKIGVGSDYLSGSDGADGKYKAYAYHTGGGWTAMSTPARVGEIAVDPSVIPLGSEVYIEGVGARRAEDTGGDIIGNTIDIYMGSEAECKSWGVRYVTIYIK